MEEKEIISEEILAKIESNPVGYCLMLLDKIIIKDKEIDDLKEKNSHLTMLAIGFKEKGIPDINVTARRFTR
jgi:hypothetical protein